MRNIKGSTWKKKQKKRRYIGKDKMKKGGELRESRMVKRLTTWKNTESLSCVQMPTDKMYIHLSAIAK